MTSPKHAMITIGDNNIIKTSNEGDTKAAININAIVEILAMLIKTPLSCENDLVSI